MSPSRACGGGSVEMGTVIIIVGVVMTQNSASGSTFEDDNGTWMVKNEASDGCTIRETSISGMTNPQHHLKYFLRLSIMPGYDARARSIASPRKLAWARLRQSDGTKKKTMALNRFHG